MRILSLILLIGCCVQLHADPWGKDADMVSCRYAKPTTQAPSPCRTPLVGTVAEVLIRFHNEVISPCDGPRSHFSPSSSYYTLDAMRKYGFLQGWVMGCDRLMRENDDDWIYRKVYTDEGTLMKYDPVR